MAKKTETIALVNASTTSKEIVALIEDFKNSGLSIVKDDKGFNLVVLKYNLNGSDVCSKEVIRTEANYSTILEQFKIEVIRLFKAS